MRRNRRRREWKYKINLANEFDTPDDLSPEDIPEVVRAICDKLKSSDAKNVEGFIEKVEELEHHTDLYDFNDDWNLFYDWCDDNNIWIETILPEDN